MDLYSKEHIRYRKYGAPISSASGVICSSHPSIDTSKCLLPTKKSPTWYDLLGCTVLLTLVVVQIMASSIVFTPQHNNPLSEEGVTCEECVTASRNTHWCTQQKVCTDLAACCCTLETLAERKTSFFASKLSYNAFRIYFDYGLQAKELSTANARVTIWSISWELFWDIWFVLSNRFIHEQPSEHVILQNSSKVDPC